MFTKRLRLTGPSNIDVPMDIDDVLPPNSFNQLNAYRKRNTKSGPKFYQTKASGYGYVFKPSPKTIDTFGTLQYNEATHSFLAKAIKNASASILNGVSLVNNAIDNIRYNSKTSPYKLRESRRKRLGQAAALIRMRLGAQEAKRPIAQLRRMGRFQNYWFPVKQSGRRETPKKLPVWLTTMGFRPEDIENL